ncbi:hypothetical protein Ahy_A04g018388 [Arachis hypogaea]|uniref:Uncharacterized protein n=1 Tax=Arachis hypogaea TaxID=3818 RepID=A0A445DDM2_ARAHY|nr:hypothetical protein Ahy_A04g018388 [Arachis hypogaea]
MFTSSPPQLESGSTPAHILVCKLVMVASMAARIHLVNAVQIAWLIPGYYSNRATCKLRQHRPFIFAGVVAVTIAFLTIGFAADIRYALGDNPLKKLGHAR